MFKLLCFGCVFSYSLFNVQLSNIFFYPYILKKILNKEVIHVLKTKFILVIIFILFASISSIIYMLENKTINMRTIIQLAFTFQYFILCINFDINTRNMEKYIINFSKLLSIFIILVFFYKGIFLNLDKLFTAERLYGQNILPGWPNSTALPLIFSIWIILKDHPSFSVNAILISVASVLTTSRMSMFTIMFLWIYFLVIKPNLNIFKGKLNQKGLLWIGIIIIVLLVLGIVLMSNESFVNRVGVTYDRQNIFDSSIEYIKNSPYIGYGGNTIDQLFGEVPNDIIMLNWKHTHNTFLEIALRYGVFPMIIFILLLWNIFKCQKSLDTKVMFVVLVILSASQLLIRNFTFLVFIFFLNTYNISNCEGETIPNMRLKETKKQLGN